MEQAVSRLSVQGPAFAGVCRSYSVPVSHQAQREGAGGSTRAVPSPRAVAVGVSVQPHTWDAAFPVPGACFRTLLQSRQSQEMKP